MAKSYIEIKGAKEHNLKDISLRIPRDKLVVITGLSGSGKSSLAFDTIYAEGQRRYVESLSAYARQFLEQMEKPDVESIEGLSPAISIEQRTTSKNPRSTVGTVTEIYDYLRLLFARVGRPHCYKCGRPIAPQTSSQIVDQVLSLPPGSKIQILAPVVRGRKGEYRRLLEEMQRQGYVRCRIDGEVYDLEQAPALDKYKKHDIEMVVDRLKVGKTVRQRLADSVETALQLAEGIVVINRLEGEDLVFSQRLACIYCGVSYPEISPRTFSFNSPHGACPVCDGLGERIELDPELVVPDPGKSIAQGAIAAWNGLGGGIDTLYMQKLKSAAEYYGFDIHTPYKDLSRQAKQIVLYGTPDNLQFSFQSRDQRNRWEWWGQYEGVIPNLERRFRETKSQHIRSQIQRFMSNSPCQGCGGARLRAESLAVKINGSNIAQVTALTVKQALAFFEDLSLTPQEQVIARVVLKEIRERLGFLVNVGLDYLTLDRRAGTLSGGEAERIRLATQIGSSLVGVLYILDEPSIGLHQRDNARLLATLKRLRDLGNTVLVVEHDAETILAADEVIDLGPGAGVKGGEVVAQGSPAQIAAHPRSLTGQYLSGRLRIPLPRRRRRPKSGYLSVVGVRENNLKDIRVDFPLGVFNCVTGVSGSGKSTLVIEVLYKALAKRLHRAGDRPGAHQYLRGVEAIDKVINIDQAPIGRTPRSNPATYTGLFTYVRELFAQVPESRLRGYKPGRFSFNVRGGRCEACEGDGIIKIEMHFLPDIYIRCEECRGRRYNRETLEIKYKGKNITQVLDMTVEEALPFFENIPPLRRKLQTLYDVGLDYIHLGQPATTLSGGEAQRIKLSKELSRISTGRTLYILDEPTTGLHFHDIKKLLEVLNRLTDAGNTVLVIEHNLDVIKTADYIIDLGPEGGDEGGRVVACGTPEEVAQNPASYTGQFLKQLLGKPLSLSPADKRVA
jgi:excinuclease ABC subunit A